MEHMLHDQEKLHTQQISRVASDFKVAMQEQGQKHDEYVTNALRLQQDQVLSLFKEVTKYIP
jgi:hypothetical protein